MSKMVESLKIELLAEALYSTGNGDKDEAVNRKILEYIAKGKASTTTKEVSDD